MKLSIKTLAVTTLATLVYTGNALSEWGGLYRTPAKASISASDRAMDCRQIEQEMAGLTPLTYSYKPGFYEDPYQGAGLTLGTTMFWPAYAVSGYSAYVDYREKERIYPAEARIETLRRLKAEKFCFEE